MKNKSRCKFLIKNYIYRLIIIRSNHELELKDNAKDNNFDRSVQKHLE